MTNKKKWNGKQASALLLLMLMLVGYVCTAAAAVIPGHTKEFYVNDFSGVLSDENKDYILNVNLDLHQKTGAQVVVVTMESLNGENLEQFATDMFRTYGIGDREKNNGILFLVVTGDRKLRIEVGYGLEGVINDAKAGRILDDYVIPYLKDNLWDQGIVNGFDALIQELCKEYNVEIVYNAPQIHKSTADDSDDETTSILWGILIVLGIIILVAYGNSDSGGSSYSSGSSRSSGSRSGSSYSGGGGSSGGGGASRSF